MLTSLCKAYIFDEPIVIQIDKSTPSTMKILKYILFIIVALVVIFLAIGFIHPSVDYGHEIKVNKPLKEAWAVSQDVSKLDQWLDGFKSIELLTGEEGAVGSTYKVIVNPGEGQPDFEMTETIVSIKEYDHINLRFNSEMMDFEQTTLFTEQYGGVMIKTESKVMGKGMVMRSMFALMEMLSGSFITQEAKNIEALKKVVEENVTDYYSVEVETEGLQVVAEETPE